MYHSDEYYRSIIETRDETIYELYSDVDDLRIQLELMEDDLQEVTDDLQEANKELAEKDKLIIYLNSIIQNLNGELERVRSENQLYQRGSMDLNV